MSINQLFEQFLGGQPGQASPIAAQAQEQAQGAGQGSGMPQGLSGLASAIPGGLTGGLAAGGALALLMGNKKLRKKATKFAGNAAMIGGAAALGTVAFQAYRNWQGQNGQPQVAAPQPQAALADTGKMPAREAPPVPMQRELSAADFDPASQKTNDGQPFQVALVMAMIAAANADGHIDADEQKAIFDGVGKMDLDAGDKALVFDTLRNPPDANAIAAYGDTLEKASELYLVSRLAIDPDEPSEQFYLHDLARRMEMPDDLVAHLESQLQPG